jgi:4-phosphopantoate--beta-alanine ligase
LTSNRRKVDPNGIKIADVVFVPLEDGDRTEALKKIGKKVISVDLNPISRTSLWSDITIVDNVIRTIPEMINYASEMKDLDKKRIYGIFKDFNNRVNIQKSLDFIIEYMQNQKEEVSKIFKE